MICPRCNAANELSWKRYWASPFGKHKCTSCQSKFRVVQTFKYSLIITGSLVVYSVPAIAFAWYLGGNIVISGILILIVGLFIIFPLDKKIDNSWRETKLI